MFFCLLICLFICLPIHFHMHTHMYIIHCIYMAFLPVAFPGPQQCAAREEAVGQRAVSPAARDAQGTPSGRRDVTHGFSGAARCFNWSFGTKPCSDWFFHVLKILKSRIDDWLVVWNMFHFSTCWE